MSQSVLEISELQLHFFTDKGVVKAIDGVDITVNEGEIVGLVGESGCGKSVTSLAVMGLVPNPPGKIVGGTIRFAGQDITHWTNKQMRKIRGKDISMIFQEPMTSLNPLFTIGDQMVEAIRIHKKCSKKEAQAMSLSMLEKVGIKRKGILDLYPHQLSGGMRQRVMIAMAMVLNPRLLIADEPTTALDVTIQAQILDLMRSLNKEYGTSILLITHDLGVVAEMCDRVIVMYAGQVVEEADCCHLFKNPTHPYTQGLLKSIPKLDGNEKRLYSIPGQVPHPLRMPQGCRFAPRCEYVMDHCWSQKPELLETEKGHLSRCWLHQAKEGSGNNGETNATNATVESS
ncbi:ABC transporter ATP-binding protein [Thermoflavimicrobium dichotomicum]|uniref:Peptide/nickel transport system ATP-binding protein n=1 Tax=Thermoflavimicrobium dichotomicum TaxID=46223 RepID=A0A1I3LUC6_9BACL|nr:ABC transporter ATP-binding protein [Thermoflavimicrobium dichotomicum]SFI88263.1 peptide/nickel transport system ATP-binding protein [Thermoflavimicrobium dichotomicum]